jgi:ribosome-associated translation inhibitor RaiA
MSAAIQITFLGMGRSEAVEAHIQRWVGKLDKTSDRIQRCTTWIEQPHHHNRKGNDFAVRVEVVVPGDILVTNDSNENVYSAISSGFRAARRQLNSRTACARR